MAGGREGSTQPPTSAGRTSEGGGRTRSRAVASRRGAARWVASAAGRCVAGGTVDAARGVRAAGVVDRDGMSAAAAVLGDGAAASGPLLGATLKPTGADDAAAGGVSALTCDAGNCVGTLLLVSMYRLQAMKPIITASPAMQNLNQKPLLLASCNGIGREWTVRGASNWLSPRAATDGTAGAGMGIGATVGGKGARVGVRVDAIDGSAPRRAAHASQNRASARFGWPHSGQAIVDDLALNIALHCA